MKRNKIKGKRKSSAKKKVVMTLASLLVIGLILVGGYLFFNDLSLNTSLKEYSKDNTLSNWLTGATVGIEEVGIEEIILEDLTIQTEATSTTCGTISANLTLTANITNTTICFTINAHNVALDCNGYGIKGDGGATDYAVTNTGGYDNITIQDCSFVTWGNGIRLATSASIGDYFYNNTFIDATSGIYVEVNSQAVILNNTFKSSSDTYGIFFNNGDNSNVTNNTFEGDYSINAIVLASSSSNNNVWQNKFFAADGINDV
ncbi:MAG TPA: NosD domain-containing protein, partial [Candidatus Nanoarchaeia archaeon]|nr:NosD domain-containing protein [Candidatus Nanoarchaeia archaeon]